MVRLFKTMAFVCAVSCAIDAGALTLDDCHAMARDNYPLLKRCDLISRTTSYSISNINRGYLPQVAFNAQMTYQSDVAAFPGILSGMLEQNGYDVLGLDRDQYRLSLEINQIIWDGGNLKSRKSVIEADGKVQASQTEVDLYAIRGRVNDLYFGLLLLEDRIKLNEDLQTLLLDNCRKLESMAANGIAMRSDVDLVRAEYLRARQDMVSLTSMRKSFQRMLAIFIGKDENEVTDLRKPSATIPLTYNNARPEMALFDAQISLIDAQERQVDAGVMPKLSLFAQGFYGYTGFNMFNDMFSHDWTLNGIVGVSLTWNIGKLYTHNNDKRKLTLNRGMVEASRETFLFNTSLLSAQEEEAIESYRRMMLDDEEIIALRVSIRQSAESKLEYGVNDVNDLLQEITRENQARIDHSTHEVEMLRSVYELRNTINQ